MTETSLLSQGNLFLRQHKKFRKQSLDISKDKDREEIDGLKTWPHPPTKSIFFSAKNLKESFKNEDKVVGNEKEEDFFALWNQYDTLMHQYTNAYHEYVNDYLNVPAVLSGCNVISTSASETSDPVTKGKKCGATSDGPWESCATFCNRKTTEDSCHTHSYIDGGDNGGNRVCHWSPPQSGDSEPLFQNGNIKFDHGGSTYYLNKFNYLRRFDGTGTCTTHAPEEKTTSIPKPNSFLKGESITADECGYEGSVVQEEGTENYAYIDPTGKGFKFASKEDYTNRHTTCGVAKSISSQLFNEMVRKGTEAAAKEMTYLPKKMSRYMHCVSSVPSAFTSTSNEKISALTELNTKLIQKAADINTLLKEIGTPQTEGFSGKMDESTEKLMEDRNKLMTLQGALDNNRLVMNSNYYKFLGWSAASILVLFLAYKQFSKK